MAITTDGVVDAPDVARVQTYRDVVRAFRTHPEAKSAGPTGQPCDRQTAGLLQRREVRQSIVVHVGKEANKLEEVEVGLEQDPEVIYTEYRGQDRDEWTTVILPRLREQNLTALSRECGISQRQLRTLLKGETQPRSATRERITRVLR